MFIGLYFLGQFTNAIGSLAPFLPTALYWVFIIFPVEMTGLVAIYEGIFVNEIQMLRPWGLSMAAMSVCYYMLARFGAKGVLDFKHKWRCLIFFGFALATLAGGFRTFMVLLAMTFAFQFFFEGLVRSRYMVALSVVSLLLSMALIPFANKLPMGIQRSLSLIPMIEVDPVARLDAQSSTEWRLEMWQRLLPEVPQYLVLGKGLSIDARQQQFALQLHQTGQGGTFGTELAGDYHNGPLSVIIPFGIFGLVGFVWLLLAGLRALWNNFQNGDPELRNINGLLLSLFLARLLVFIVVFGGFYGDLMNFTGILGLSIALNGGIQKPVRSHSFVRPLARPA